jgi:hypothetical protein
VLGRITLLAEALDTMPRRRMNDQRDANRKRAARSAGQLLTIHAHALQIVFQCVV